MKLKTRSEPEHPRDLFVVVLVAQHVLADGARRSQPAGIAHVVIGRTQEIAGVALGYQLGNGACCIDRDVIGMGLDRQEHLALVGRLGRRPLEVHSGRRFLGLCAPGPHQRGAAEHRSEEVAPLHRGLLCFTSQARSS